MTPIRLSKLEATGNDFLVLAPGEHGWRPDASDVQVLCDRHRGVGADGFLTLLPGSDGADLSMVLRNADGGIAEMSGNGIRCLAWVAVRDGLVTGDRLVVDTGAGRRLVDLDRDDSGVLRAAGVDMGPVTFDPPAIPLDAPSPFGLEGTVHGTEYSGDAAGTGNPHWVVFVDDPGEARVTEHGPRLERDPRFPSRANVEFVRVEARERLRMRVWERGVGETLSCGTGACAAAAVAHHRGLVDEQLTVAVPGGELQVGVGDTVRLAGPVHHVFDVDIDVNRLARS